MCLVLIQEHKSICHLSGKLHSPYPTGSLHTERQKNVSYTALFSGGKIDKITLRFHMFVL
ncbi:hypothetical protein CHCC5021_3990 [Bacillus paralicheniformis]|nr:hypothetical protein CHCC5021_3990 [Bacillus paralicheniformis]